MATKIEAYKGLDGVIYESREQAEKAELRAAVLTICAAEEAHLMNVAFGHSTCAKTRDALLLIANRLPPLAEPAPPFVEKKPTYDRHYDSQGYCDNPARGY